MNSEELEPIDAERCQGESRESSFMTFGIPSFIRCSQKPRWIAISVRSGTFYGAMSLCDECKKVCEIRMPDISFQKLGAVVNETP